MSSNYSAAAHQTHQALLRTTLGAMMISFSAVFVKLAHVNPTVSGFYRVFLGGCFLLVILLVRRELRWYGWHFLGLALVTGIFFALDLYAWHRSIKYVGPGLATILGNFEVFMVPVVGFFLYGEKPPFRLLLSVPPAMAGLFMIVGTPWGELTPDFRVGIYYGLATAVFYTGFLVMFRKMQAHADTPPAVYNLMVISFASALFLALDMVRTGASFAIPDTQSLAALGGLALMSQTLGWLLIGHSMPKIPAAVAGLVLLLQPSLSFVWDVLFFNRETSPMAWTGVALALCAIYIGATSTKAGGPEKT
ncbi:MAG: DMT family transporter [Desulfotignum sp.]|nr:DMT family transporter [Desulfotignum sp.]MCF8126592.1 DMT family transporter [Desulfotignum sp.]